MGGLVFYNPEHRILISGDALWEHGFGFVMPPRGRPGGAARDAGDARDAGRARHPRRHSGARRAVHRRRRGARARALARLAAFEADSLRVARHALKVNFAFVLLDKQSMPLADMPAYLDRIGLYRDFNAQFFRLPPGELAELLIGELERAGGVKREDGWLVPAVGSFAG